MKELKGIIAEHRQYEIGASEDTDYKIIRMCFSDCPACAQKMLVAWLFQPCVHSEPEINARLNNVDCPYCVVELHRKVGL